MASGLLKAWNAPSIVSAVELDASNGKILATNAKVKGFAKNGTALSWTQHDNALPFPLDLNDGIMNLVLRSSDFMQSFDQQTIKVAGMSSGQTYALRIDGADVAKFTGAQLGEGVNIAGINTPMFAQAKEVMRLVRAHTDIHNMRWRNLEVPYANLKVGDKERVNVIKSFDAYDRAVYAQARKAAQPKAHRFEIVESAS